jgi:hypothetical protein
MIFSLAPKIGSTFAYLRLNIKEMKIIKVLILTNCQKVFSTKMAPINGMETFSLNGLFPSIFL